MEEDPNTSDSGAQFGADVDDIYGGEDEDEDEEEPDQPETRKNKKCSG
jgi:hypothetical protein